MTDPGTRAPALPPRWIIRAIWRGHRTLYRATGGRIGLSRPTPAKAGIMRLRTTGRASGRERAVMLCYLEDGASLATLAMNGWGAAAPAWSLNLRAHPDAEVDLVDGSRRVRARVAQGAERDRLWTIIAGARGWGEDLEALAALRSRETDVVVLDPR
ncbi:MAG: nitroreductase/quinone reductase family protein [Protaetiibacter sp.]